MSAGVNKRSSYPTVVTQSLLTVPITSTNEGREMNSMEVESKLRPLALEGPCFSYPAELDFYSFCITGRLNGVHDAQALTNCQRGVCIRGSHKFQHYDGDNYGAIVYIFYNPFSENVLGISNLERAYP